MCISQYQSFFNGSFTFPFEFDELVDGSKVLGVEESAGAIFHDYESLVE